jgi:protoporphyrinogen oxidase
MQDPERHIAVIGGGPAGLTAAYLLAKEGWRVSVFEGDSDRLGGQSRTVQYKGFGFDVGGHPFESRSSVVTEFWAEILGRDLVTRPRLSRLAYKGQIFPYPRSASEVLPKLGLQEAMLSGLSYLQACLRTSQAPKSFEEWGTTQFGTRLFGLLFQNYAHKSWDGGAEPSRATAATFPYPRLGPGQMWERCGEKIRAYGGSVYLGHYVMSMEQMFDNIWTVNVQGPKGREIQVRAAHVISTTEIRELIHMIQPTVSAQAVLSGSSLHYRDFLSVALILRDFRNLPDQTLHLYDREIKAAKLQNFKAWSPDLVPDPAYASYALEYFRPREDELWDLSDRELISFAAQELERAGLARAHDVEDGYVIRQEKALPLYDNGYAGHIQTIRRDIVSRYPGLHLAGRNGMHKAHNLDQAMLTGMLVARNILEGNSRYDVWDVNPGGELQRKLPAPERPATPQLLPSRPATAAGGVSGSGLRLVSNRSRTAEQLAALDKHLSAFRGPSPNAVGMFKVHAGGAGVGTVPKPGSPAEGEAEGEKPTPPPPSAA